MTFNDAMIAKITMKKILSLMDHIQIVLTHNQKDNGTKLVLQDWFDEMRLHLRKVEYSVEAAAE